MTPEDVSNGEDLGPTNVFYPANLSEVVGLKDPQLKVKPLGRPFFFFFFLLKCNRVIFKTNETLKC